MKLEQTLYEEGLCDKRWTSSYYQSTQRLFSQSCGLSGVRLSVTDSTKSKLNQHQKYRKAAVLTSELATVVSSSSRVHFVRRMELLMELTEYWKEGKKVALTEIDDLSSDEDFEDTQLALPSTLRCSTAGSSQIPNEVLPLSLSNDEPCSIGLHEIPHNTSNQQGGHSSLGLKMPPNIKRRGRPRWHDLTTIGLPAKKGRRSSKKKPRSFLLLHTSEKERVILSWFVDLKFIEAATKNDLLIEEENVECRPEKVSDAIVDENVDIGLVRKYFTEYAWKIIVNVLECKKTKMSWKCHSCFHDLHTEQSIACDGCLLWFHFRCVALSKQPKAKAWFCRSCNS